MAKLNLPFPPCSPGSQGVGLKNTSEWSELNTQPKPSYLHTYGSIADMFKHLVGVQVWKKKIISSAFPLMGRKIFFNFTVQRQTIFFPQHVVESSTEARKLIETIITVTVLINCQTCQLTHAR